MPVDYGLALVLVLLIVALISWRIHRAEQQAWHICDVSNAEQLSYQEAIELVSSKRSAIEESSEKILFSKYISEILGATEVRGSIYFASGTATGCTVWVFYHGL